MVDSLDKNAYLAVTGRRWGVPEMWLEDYIQEVKIKIWCSPSQNWKLIARSMAIDYARKFNYGRARSKRPSMIPIEEVTEKPSLRDFTSSVNMSIDLLIIWLQIKPRFRRAILRRAWGYPARNATEEQARSLGTKKLRELYDQKEKTLIESRAFL